MSSSRRAVNPVLSLGGACAHIKKPRAERRGFLALLNSNPGCFNLPLIFLLHPETVIILFKGKSNQFFSRDNPFGKDNVTDRNNPQPFRNSQSYPLPAE
jgi:hypothetical protein